MGLLHQRRQTNEALAHVGRGRSPAKPPSRSGSALSPPPGPPEPTAPPTPSQARPPRSRAPEASSILNHAGRLYRCRNSRLYRRRNSRQFRHQVTEANWASPPNAQPRRTGPQNGPGLTTRPACWGEHQIGEQFRRRSPRPQRLTCALPVKTHAARTHRGAQAFWQVTSPFRTDWGGSLIDQHNFRRVELLGSPTLARHPARRTNSIGMCWLNGGCDDNLERAQQATDTRSLQNAAIKRCLQWRGPTIFRPGRDWGTVEPAAN